jgi:hypothetical protein
MKHIKILIILIIVSFSSFKGYSQEYYGNVTGFSVTSATPVTVYQNTTSTTIKFSVTVQRTFAGITPGGESIFRPCKMNIKLVIENGETLSSVFTITDADFKAGQATTDKEFTADIVNTKLPNGKYITLQYNVPIYGATTYSTYGSKKYIINNTTGGGTTNPPVDPNIAKIAAMGFNTNGLKTYATYYVVENDIRISKSALAQNGTNYIINNNYDHNINILIDSQLVDRWYGKVSDAIRVWNSTANSNIKVNLLTNNATYAVSPRIDVSIIRNGGLSASATEAQFPDGNGTPGTLIAVNQTSPGNLVHAIGHILGLKHTPTNAPDYQNSVMKLASAVELLSVYDVDKIATMYPVNNNSIVKPYIVGRQTLSNNFEQNSWFVSYLSNEPGINYHWKVIKPDGTIYYDSPSNESSLSELGGMSKGTYQLQCTISGGKYLTPVTLTKDIIEL